MKKQVLLFMALIAFCLNIETIHARRSWRRPKKKSLAEYVAAPERTYMDAEDVAESIQPSEMLQKSVTERVTQPEGVDIDEALDRAQTQMMELDEDGQEAEAETAEIIQEPTAEDVPMVLDMREVEERPTEAFESDTDILVIESDDIDIDRKRAQVIELVDRAADFFNRKKLYEACNAFSHSLQFIRGELYIFVIDFDGNYYAHGEQAELVWQNGSNLQDMFGTYIIRDMINVARKGGGWTTYEWRGATKVSYVKEVVKNNRSFVIGCGYYPHSKADAVVSLVKGAASYFNEFVNKEGKAVSDAFSTLSYPLGRFVKGDLYLYALDFKGNTMAHGEQPSLIGTNAWDYRDAQGLYVNREIVERLKDSSGGVWVEYQSRGAPKRAYAEQVSDQKGNNYFIACGYYPTADRDQVENLVRKGYQYMKTHGVNTAADKFTDKRDNTFRYGDLNLFVYNFKGKCIANGANPSLVGQNMIGAQDEGGRYYVREMIQKVQGKARRGWTSFKMKNSFQSAYVEAVEVGLEQYVIGCGIYPISKSENMLLLAKSAVSFLRASDPVEAFRSFVNPNGRFRNGDLYVVAFAQNGICLAHGNDYDMIWGNFLDAKDDNGRPYVKMMINTSKMGPGKVTFIQKGAERIEYVEQVEKDGMLYTIGSGYYK